MQTYFFPQRKDINHLTDLDIYYHQSFIPLRQANGIFKELLSYNYFSAERSAVIMAGKKTYVPRKQIWFSDPKTYYRFSGNEMNEEKWPILLNEIRHNLNKFLIEKGIIPFHSDLGFNAVLVNYYRDGNDYIGWHSDKTGDLIRVQGQTIIVSLTFGINRPFIFRRKDDHSVQYSLKLNHGDLLIIKGKTNDFWEHALPKRLNIKKPRINLTFRIVKRK